MPKLIGCGCTWKLDWRDEGVDLRDIRKEQADQRALLISAVDYMRKMEQRLDSRMVAIRDDPELMLTSELLGALTPFETKIDQRIAALEG